MLIPRNAAHAALAVSGTDFRTETVLIEERAVTATNGHILMRVAYKPPADEQYPSLNGSGPGAGGLIPVDGITVKAPQLAMALKGVPKRACVPVLAHVAVNVQSLDKVSLAATDLESVTRIDADTSGRFPAWRNVLPDPSACTLRVGLSLSVLDALCKSLKAAGTDSVILSYQTKDPAESAIRLDATTTGGLTLTGCMMPRTVPA